MDYDIFKFGDVTLQSGVTLPNAFLAYKTYGKLNEQRDNVVVYPTAFGDQHVQNEWLIGDGMALDPEKYFIIVPNLLGNGLSSSPSNTPPPFDRANFPRVTIYDNVVLQHRLVTELFGIQKIALVVGWSMGGIQAFQWGQVIPIWWNASRLLQALPKHGLIRLRSWKEYVPLQSAAQFDSNQLHHLTAADMRGLAGFMRDGDFHRLSIEGTLP